MESSITVQKYHSLLVFLSPLNLVKHLACKFAIIFQIHCLSVVQTANKFIKAEQHNRKVYATYWSFYQEWRHCFGEK